MKYVKENKISVLLFLTIIFGFVFRLINVHTRILLGDPPHFCLEAQNFLNSGLLVIWDQSGYLWYAVTNIFYNLFGISQFTCRFSSLLFATLTIPLIYLFVLEFSGNKRMAIISAIIYAFAPGFIWHTSDEHDISTLFFIMLSFYSLLLGLNKKSKNYLIISAVFFGVSCMWKAYVPVLLIPYFGLIYYHHRSKRFDYKVNRKTLIYMLIIMFLLITPTLTYNYLNYKYNGVTDFLFVTQFPSLKNDKMQSLYGWTAGGEINRKEGFFKTLLSDASPLNDSDDRSLLYIGLTTSIYGNGKILTMFALICLIYLFLKRKKDSFAKDYLIFFLLYLIIPFIFIVKGNTLTKHYVHFLAFSIPMMAFLIDNFYLSLIKKYSALHKILNKNYNFLILYFILLLYVFFILTSIVSNDFGSFYSRNPEDNLIKFKNSNIPEKSLIIYDDRIYNSQAGWLFINRHYIPVSFLNEFLEYNEKSKSVENIPVYVVECVIDDCGWGTISKNPQLNNSMEMFFDSLNNQSIPVVMNIESKITLKDTNYYNPFISKKINMGEHYKIYKTQLPIDLSIAKQVKLQYEYFLYPTEFLNKESKNFKNFIYAPIGLKDIAINKITWLVFYLNIILSFASIIYLIYECFIRI